MNLSVFEGGDRDPEAAARGQSDVHQNGGETEDGQDGGRLGAEMERRTAVKEPNTNILDVTFCFFRLLFTSRHSHPSAS